MRILMTAMGTRGDVQPMVALAKGLQAAGHQIAFIAGGNFEQWVSSHGLEFVPTLDTEALMQSEAGLEWVNEGSNPRIQLRQMRLLLERHWRELAHPMHAQIPAADLVIGGFVAEPFLQTLCAHLGKPLVNAYLQPLHPTKSGAATVQPIFPSRKSILNRGSGLLAQWLLWGVGAGSLNQLRQELALSPLSFLDYKRAHSVTPTILGVSPYVVPPPDDWGAHVRTLGYWFLDEGQEWQPPESLAAFLKEGAPPVYIGFGSMPAKEPVALARMVKAALEAAGARGIFARGWTGDSDLQSDARMYLLDKAPHDWLFPRMAGVIHHGGAGTTAAGLRAGVPTLIVPHTADQPYWGRRVEELGVGAKAIPRPKLTVERLAAGIHQLTTQPELREAAQQLGARIRVERGIEEAVRLIETFAAEAAVPRYPAK